MRILIPLLFWFLALAPAAAQNRVDSVALAPGITQVYHRTLHRMPLTKAERFMRGMATGNADEPALYRFDSTYIFTAEGRRTGTKTTFAKNTGEFYHQVRADGRARYVRVGEDGRTTIEGGGVHPVNAPTAAPRAKRVRRGEEGPQAPGKADYFTYDLSEADFVPRQGREEVPELTLERGAEELLLSLWDTEKFLVVYHDDRVFRRLTIGRMVDRISLYGWPAGKFLLEIQDLRTGGKRYYGLVKE